MLVLLDNDVPYGLRRLIRPHGCFHAKQLGWESLSNGHLLRAAEARNFDVMVTADQSIYKQQNNAKRRIALVALNTTNWKRIRMAHEAITVAVSASIPGKEDPSGQLIPGSFTEIDVPYLP